jgi:alpha-mannosidase
VDPAKGGVVSLVDKAAGRELVAGTGNWAFGQPIYETLTEGRDFAADKFRRAAWSDVKVEPGVAGPLWKSVVLTGKLGGCDTNRPARLEIRLFETEKRVELHYGIRKLPVQTAEAVYVAFPFRGDGAGLAYEAQGGLVVPGRGQLPGSASDWQTVQNYLTVRDGAGQIVWGSEQVPLVQLGDINLGKWQKETQVQRPDVFSWVMNNYWFTNFRVSQEGEFRWNYYLTSLTDAAPEAAAMFGWGSRIPLVARVLPELHGKSSGLPATGSVLTVDAPGVVVVDARPAGEQTAWLHLREVAGKRTVLDGSNVRGFGGLQGAEEVNVLGEVIRSDVTALEMEPFAVKFLRIRLGRQP